MEQQQAFLEVKYLKVDGKENNGDLDPDDPKVVKVLESITFFHRKLHDRRNEHNIILTVGRENPQLN